VNIIELRVLSNKLISSSDDEVLTIYLLDAVSETPAPDQINRTAGNPIGIREDVWPMYNGRKMEHALTLDLDSVPLFKKEIGSNYRAVAVFIDSLLEGNAYSEKTDEAAVVFLSQSDIDIGEVPFDPGEIRQAEYNRQVEAMEEFSKQLGPESDGFLWRLYDYVTDFFFKGNGEGLVVEDTDEVIEKRTFTCHEMQVPLPVFNEEVEEGSDMEKLLIGLQYHGYVGGKPNWLQSEAYDKKLYIQFNEGLVDMNLGDGGFMYVFEDTAFYQSH